MQLLALLTFLLALAQLYDSVKSNTTGKLLIALNGALTAFSFFPIFLGLMEIIFSVRSKRLRMKFRILQFLFPDDVEYRQQYLKRKRENSLGFLEKSIYCNPFKNRTTYCNHEKILKCLPKKKTDSEVFGLRKHKGFDKRYYNDKNWANLDYDVEMINRMDVKTIEQLLADSEDKNYMSGNFDFSQNLDDVFLNLLRGHGAVFSENEGVLMISGLRSRFLEILIDNNHILNLEGNFSLSSYKFRLEYANGFNSIYKSNSGNDSLRQEGVNPNEIKINLTCNNENSDINWPDIQISFNDILKSKRFLYKLTWCMGFLMRNNRTCCFVSNGNFSKRKNSFTGEQVEVHHCLDWDELIESCKSEDMHFSLVETELKEKIFEGEFESFVKKSLYEDTLETLKDSITSQFGERSLKVIENVIQYYKVSSDKLVGIYKGINLNVIGETGLKNWQNKRFMRDISWVIESNGRCPLKNITKIVPSVFVRKLIKKEEIIPWKPVPRIISNDCTKEFAVIKPNVVMSEDCIPRALYSKPEVKIVGDIKTRSEVKSSSGEKKPFVRPREAGAQLRRFRSRNPDKDVSCYSFALEKPVYLGDLFKNVSRPTDERSEGFLNNDFLMMNYKEAILKKVEKLIPDEGKMETARKGVKLLKEISLVKPLVVDPKPKEEVVDSSGFKKIRKFRNRKLLGENADRGVNKAFSKYEGIKCHNMFTMLLDVEGEGYVKVPAPKMGTDKKGAIISRKLKGVKTRTKGLGKSNKRRTGRKNQDPQMIRRDKLLEEVKRSDSVLVSSSVEKVVKGILIESTKNSRIKGFVHKISREVNGPSQCIKPSKININKKKSRKRRMEEGVFENNPRASKSSRIKEGDINKEQMEKIGEDFRKRRDEKNALIAMKKEAKEKRLKEEKERNIKNMEKKQLSLDEKFKRKMEKKQMDYYPSYL